MTNPLLAAISRHPTLSEKEKDRLAYYYEAIEVMGTWGMRRFLQLLREVGLFASVSSRHTAQDIIAHLNSLPSYTNQLQALLTILCEQQLLTLFAGGEYALGARYSTCLDNHQSLLKRYPEYQVNLAFLDTLSASYLQVLSGQRSLLNLLIPHGNLSLLEDLYQKTPNLDFYNHWMAQLAAEAINNEQDTPFAILEVGAGTGGVASYLLPILQDKFLKRNKQYFYTDVSKAFLMEGIKKFGDKFDFLCFEQFDINHKIGNRLDNQFDIVLANNVLHNARNIQSTLGFLHGLLRPRGILMLEEAVRSSAYTQLIYGLMPEWREKQDQASRIANSPLLTLSQWEEELNKAGFKHVCSVNRAFCIKRSTEDIVIAQKL